MKVKDESEKVGLKLNFQKTNIMASGHHFMANRWVPGASVRNSARGKGHEEGGLAYAKARSSLRSPPGNSWQMGKQWQTLFWGVPKSLQMVTVAMKLKDTYPLEGML